MDLVKELKSELSEYTSIPFWSWNNELDAAELLRQIGEFKALGIDGFIIHARTGLKTEYLGKKWFECVRVCLNEAKRLGMQVWLYDENGWPSGFVEGRLLKEGNYAQFITYEVKEFYDKEASAVYAVKKGKAKRLTPGGKAEKFHCLYIKDHLSYADILDEKVVTQFINSTHEEYYKRFENSFGKEFAGFFTDEPQYYRWGTAYSRVLPDEYKKAYGEDIFDGLIYLFVDGEQSKAFRYKYFSLLNKLFTEVFYKRIYDWCEEHNCKLTGHAVEETRIFAQMWCCAGVMPSYEYEHIPGIDWLGREPDCAISPKQAGSVAQQLGKKQVLTETFGCSGWDTTPRQLRWITEFQYVNGVNMMCQHLVSYSLKGQGKSDHPPSFSNHNLWINHSKPFNNYFKRLSYILCNTAEQADSLVIHPIRSAYITYLREADYESIREIEDAFINLTKKLSMQGVQYHYGDERILSKYARVEGKDFIVGACRYKRVLVPKMESMESTTIKLIKEFLAAGGEIIFIDKPPIRENAVIKNISLNGNNSLNKIQPAFDLKTRGGEISVSHRKGDIGEFLYIVNSSETEAAAIEYKEGFTILDLENIEIKRGVIPLNIPSMSSVMLKLEPSVKPLKAAISKETDITDKFLFISSDDNTLTLDFASYSKDGKNWSPQYFVQYINELLIKEKHTGELWLKYSFNVKDKPGKARILFEKNKNITVSINGKNLKAEQSGFDMFFAEFDAAAALKTGENEFVMRMNYFQKPNVCPTLYDSGVMESLKNCLAIDTELESAYLTGDFCVNEKREIIKLLPPSNTAKIQKQGYPNFAGAVTFKGKIEYEEKDCSPFLKLDGQYMTASVKVNGKSAGELILLNTLDLSKYIVKGFNDIEITITSSMRNMLGPHHFRPDPEPKAVGHYHFNFRGTWADGKAPDYTAEYNLVNFGLDKIVLIKEFKTE